VTLSTIFLYLINRNSLLSSNFVLFMEKELSHSHKFLTEKSPLIFYHSLSILFSNVKFITRTWQKISFNLSKNHWKRFYKVKKNKKNTILKISSTSETFKESSSFYKTSKKSKRITDGLRRSNIFSFRGRKTFYNISSTK